MTNIYRTPMRAQYDILDTDWAEPSTIVRPTKTTDAQGQIVETPVTISTDELLWVQPSAGSSEIEQGNLNDRTTHLIFQKYSGLELEANDQITPNSGNYAGKSFDILSHFVYESHRLSEAQLVVKI